MTVKFRVPSQSRVASLLLAAVLMASAGSSQPVRAVEPDIPEKLMTEADALAVLIRQKAGDRPESRARCDGTLSALHRRRQDPGGGSGAH